MAKKKIGQLRKKRTQIINQITQAVRKASTKEDEIKKDSSTQVEVKRKNSVQRGVYDFKKP